NRVLHAKLQFFDVKRLGNVVIRAEFQPLNLVTSFVFLRQEDDGDVTRARRGAEFATDIIAVHVRQHDVEHDQVRKLLARHGEGIPTTRSDLHFVALPAEVNAQHVGYIKVIFDD